MLETTVPVWGMDPPPAPGFDAGRTPYAFNIVHQNPDIMALFLRNYGLRTVTERINVACWVWELNAGYPEWHRFTRLFHDIWAPTHFVADSLRSVSTTPIHVVPYPVEAPAACTYRRSDLGLPENVFLFLYVFDLASTIGRKNPMALLRAFNNAFADRRDVCLVLKYHNATCDAPAAETLQRLASGRANVRLLDMTLPASKVDGLIRLCDCFVSPHRSEGFGFNIAAAMYHGKPVIATGYSGNMDFMSKETAFLIDYELVPVGRGHAHYREGFGWADPSVEHLATLMKQVHDHQDAARRIAEAGRGEIVERYSTSAVARVIEKRIAVLSSGGV
jgi:glycosyltransferase involved in cell wall biosynthesis